MWTKRCLLAVTLCILVSASGCRNANDPRQVIQAAYNKMDTGIDRKDIEAAMSAKDANYQHVSEKGKVRNATQERDFWQGIFAHSSAVESRTQIVDLSLRGQEARVTAKQSWNRRYIIPSTGQPGEFRGEYTDQDVWVKSGQGWRLKSTHVQSARTARNQVAAR